MKVLTKHTEAAILSVVGGMSLRTGLANVTTTNTGSGNEKGLHVGRHAEATVSYSAIFLPVFSFTN